MHRRLAKNQGGIPCPACDAPPWVIETHLQDQLEVSTTVQYAAALRYQLFDAERNRQKVKEDLDKREDEAKAAGLAFEASPFGLYDARFIPMLADL